MQVRNAWPKRELWKITLVHTNTATDARACGYPGVHARTPTHECSRFRWSITGTLFSSVEEENAHLFRNKSVSSYIKRGSDWLQLEMDSLTTCLVYLNERKLVSLLEV